MKITEKYLEDIGFEVTVVGGAVVYDLNGYKLKPELGSWLIIGENSGIDLTGLEVIDTVEELEKHYIESTGNQLKKIIK
jgi:hypothetical protein